jgi:asparagine synthase (glutamine-hydrolysing)
MCGIVGVFRANGEPVPEGVVATMVATMHHRGPDGEGAYARPGIALGFRRLAVIDLSHASDQPFVDETGEVALVFNGEIYNYVELRDELRRLGHAFRSTGDTEVLLRAYLEWGTDCVERLNGMFAFAIWDGRRRELVLARDRFGEKPLHIARTPRGLLFASEIKALLAVRPELRRPNQTAIYRYLSRGDLNLDAQTFFMGVESLPAAHVLVVDDHGRGEPRRYWTPHAARVSGKRAQAIEGFRELLFDAVRLRLRSDVPIGSSLSGGIDSSSIVATIDAMKGLRPIRQRTFSARFDATGFDEGRYIDAVAQRMDAEAHHVWVDPEQFMADYARLQWHQEEPIASASPYAQYAVMRLAREHDTTVLLDGQGADELLAGYDQSHGLLWAQLLRAWRPDRVLREAIAFACRYRNIAAPARAMGFYLAQGARRDELADRYFGAGPIIAPGLRAREAPAHAESPAPFADGFRNELVRWQTTTQLPEFLRYADRNSMAFSREVRLPYLDHRLAEYCMGLRRDLLLKDAVTKVVLREAMRGIVPDEILDRRDKLAYAPPQVQWMRGPLREWVSSMLLRAAGRRDIYDAQGIERLRANGAHRSPTLAWRVASLEGWWQVMIEGEGAPYPSAAAAAAMTW